MKRIAVIGAAAVGDYIFQADHLPEKGEIIQVETVGGYQLVPGGCAPNIAAGMKALGKIEPTLYYPVGDDPETEEIIRGWTEKGLHTKLTVVPGEASGRAFLVMQPDGSTICLSLLGASKAARVTNGKIPEEWVLITPVLCDYTETWLEMAVLSGKTIAVSGIGTDGILSHARQIRYIFVNRHESEQLCRAAGVPGLKELSERYWMLTLFVTDGTAGSRVYRNGSFETIPAVRADAFVDSTGAGDAYTGGTLSALMMGIDEVTAAYYGAACASYVVEAAGGQTGLPAWDMLEARLAVQFPEMRSIIDREGEA